MTCYTAPGIISKPYFEVLKKICDNHKINVSDIQLKTRKARFAMARAEYSYFLIKKHGLKQKEAALIVGCKRESIPHYLNTIENFRTVYPQFNQYIEELIN